MPTPTDWKFRLDAILADAREEAAGRHPTSKTAAAPAAEPSSLVKQAQDVVASLRLVTGQTPHASLADILRKEGEAGKSPGVTSSTTGGTQAEPPRSGSASVTQSPGPKAARPTESAAGSKGASLHDIIMRGREAAEKSAGKGGPAETEAGDPSGKTPAGLTKLVGSSEAVVDMTKRDALAQTRPSLQALLKNVNDSANEAAARAAFPAAVAKGGLKIASDLELARSFQKQAEEDEPAPRPGMMGLHPEDAAQARRHLLQAATGLPGTGVWAARGAAPGRRMSTWLGSHMGGAVGSLPGSALQLMGMAAEDHPASDAAQLTGAVLGRLGYGLGTVYGAGKGHQFAREAEEGERHASATPHQIAIAMQRAL